MFLEIIDLAAWYLGQGLAIAVNLFNPEMDVGGGMAGEVELSILCAVFSQMLRALGRNSDSCSR